MNFHQSLQRPYLIVNLLVILSVLSHYFSHFHCQNIQYIDFDIGCENCYTLLIYRLHTIHIFPHVIHIFPHYSFRSYFFVFWQNKKVSFQAHAFYETENLLLRFKEIHRCACASLEITPFTSSSLSGKIINLYF